MCREKHMAEIDRNRAVELLRRDLVELVALVVGSVVDQHGSGAECPCESRRARRAAPRCRRDRRAGRVDAPHLRRAGRLDLRFGLKPEGRTVIITGCASGIGASFVRAFVENGAKVAFLDQQRETGATLANSLGEGSKPMPRPRQRSSASPIRSPGRWGRTASGSTRSRPAPYSPSASASCGSGMPRIHDTDDILTIEP